MNAHLRHGQSRLDTNAVENAIRPSKLGAKNWLFVGHPDAGDRAAVIYSLVVSCQRHGHDPHAYLRGVLSRLPAMTTDDDLRPAAVPVESPRRLSSHRSSRNYKTCATGTTISPLPSRAPGATLTNEVWCVDLVFDVPQLATAVKLLTFIDEGSHYCIDVFACRRLGTRAVVATG